MPRDILSEMVVTTENGDIVMFFDRRNHATDDTRSEMEAARLDNLMKLGVRYRKAGDMVRIASDNNSRPLNIADDGEGSGDSP